MNIWWKVQTLTHKHPGKSGDSPQGMDMVMNHIQVLCVLHKLISLNLFTSECLIVLRAPGPSAQSASDW